MADLPRQLPLALAHAPGLSRDDLIVTASNAAAARLIDDWPDWSTPVAVLVGPPGSGKSHCAAIWKARAGAVELAADRLSAGWGAGEGGSVLVEDVDAGAVEETALFHLINAVRGSGGSLLMTARRRPASWPVALPDLRSRLGAAFVAEIEAPDDALMEGVITKLFADRQIGVEPNVVSFLVRRIERSLETAAAVVDALDVAALEEKSRITRAFASSVLKDSRAGQGSLDF